MKYLLQTINRLRNIVGHYIDNAVRVFNESENVFLTFDDGPHPEYTLKIASMLEEKGHFATFFFTGEQAERYPDVVKTIASSDHSIGSHSYSHLKGWKSNFINLFQDYKRGHSAVSSSSDSNHINLFRPPFGHYDWKCKICAKILKLNVVLWTVDSYDWVESMSSEQIVEDLEKNLKAGSVILLHDWLQGYKIDQDRAECIETVKLLISTLDRLKLRSAAIN